jgi:hypothetical protein
MRESWGKGLKRSKSSFRSSEGRNHPFEGTPSPQYERNIDQESQFYISIWPNENQPDSYHETHLWPWPLSSISVYHQLCEIVGKRRSISRKVIHSWWPSVSRSQVVRVVWKGIFLDCTKCTTMTTKESLNLLPNEKFSISLKAFHCYQWHWLFLLDGLSLFIYLVWLCLWPTVTDGSQPLRGE